MSRRRRWGLAALLLLLALAAHQSRRGLIVAFFPDGGAGPSPSLEPSADDGTGQMDPAPRVRVVLIDGLGAEVATELPNVDRLCREGLDLRVDNGFPTVSLPVQHVLWTGLTQAQSGVMYRIQPLPKPPRGSLPSRVRDSVAVAESHAGIVHSFGFARAQPPLEDVKVEAGDAPWRDDGFVRAATEAVASHAPLAFVHVLRVDEAGHAHGAASSAYAEAARWADALLGELVRADVDPGTRWLVLSDHGHRSAGGHGGAEDSIRIVRACVFGNVPAVSSRGRTLHLVDLHRMLAESLGVQPLPDCRGRSLERALQQPSLGATLPRPSWPRWMAALAWIACGIAATAWAVGGRVGRLPWWLGVAYLGVLAVHGVPTLSNPMIYPPLGRDMMLCALPAAFVLAWTDAHARAGTQAMRRVVGHLALLVSATLATLTLCGGLEALLGLHERPPLVPLWTAHASLMLTLTALGGVTAALVLLRPGAPPRRPRAGSDR